MVEMNLLPWRFYRRQYQRKERGFWWSSCLGTVCLGLLVWHIDLTKTLGEMRDVEVQQQLQLTRLKPSLKEAEQLQAEYTQLFRAYQLQQQLRIHAF